MNLDRYAQLDSPLHAWDPRLKLLCLGLLIFVFAFAGQPHNLLLIAGTAILLVLVSRIPLSFVLRALRAPLVFLLLMTPLLALTSGGEILFSLGFLRLYASGLEAAGRIAVRALSIMLVFIALFGTTPLHQTLKALAFYKIPGALLMIFLFTYRYLFLYIEDLGKLFTAARLRGYSPGRGLRHLGNTVSILVTLLIRSYEQSERIDSAMRLRGFTDPAANRIMFHAGAVDPWGGSRLAGKDFWKGAVILSLGGLITCLELL